MFVLGRFMGFYQAAVRNIKASIEEMKTDTDQIA